MPLICLSSFYTQIHKRRTMMLQNGLEEKRGWWDGSSVYRGPAPSHEEQTVHPAVIALKTSGAGAGFMSPRFKKIACPK